MGWVQFRSQNRVRMRIGVFVAFIWEKLGRVDPILELDDLGLKMGCDAMIIANEELCDTAYDKWVRQNYLQGGTQCRAMQNLTSVVQW